MAAIVWPEPAVDLLISTLIVSIALVRCGGFGARGN